MAERTISALTHKNIPSKLSINVSVGIENPGGAVHGLLSCPDVLSPCHKRSLTNLRKLWYSTVQYSTAQYSTVQYSPPRRAVPWSRWWWRGCRTSHRDSDPEQTCRQRSLRTRLRGRLLRSSGRLSYLLRNNETFHLTSPFISKPSPKQPSGLPPLRPHPSPYVGAAPGEFQGWRPASDSAVPWSNMSSGSVTSDTEVKLVNQAVCPAVLWHLSPVQPRSGT